MTMRIFGKTISYCYEKCGGTLWGCFAFALFLIIIKPEYYSCKELIQEFPSIGMCAFGFMLTFLGIILQGDSTTIKYIKSRDVLYKRFISYNKIVVILSLIISIYSYFIGYAEIKIIISSIIPYYSYIKDFIIALFWGLVTKLFVDMCVFVKIFYLLLK